jgi:hypothetical protein
LRCHEEEEKLAKARSKSWYFKVSAVDRFSYCATIKKPESFTHQEKNEEIGRRSSS